VEAGVEAAREPVGDLGVVRIDLFQAVRVPIVAEGVEADRRELPVIAGREAMVRIFVEEIGAWEARVIRAVIEVEAGGVTWRGADEREPRLPGVSGDPESVFAIRVPAEMVVPGARYRVWLEEVGAPGMAEDAMAEARFPRDARFAELGVESLPPLVLVLVPFRYETDGSDRLPNTGDDVLEAYRAELTAVLPYAEIDLRVHDVVPWARATRISGNVDWGDVNQELIEMREREGAAEEEYWYGLISPDTSRGAYCDAVAGTCTTGQAYVATLRGNRVGSGVGFGDSRSVGTLAHELGHMHGRYHAPCETSGEAGYPYAGGHTGVWGWDRRDGSFHDPEVATDLMGYCDDAWISDYTYRAMYLRHRALIGGAVAGGEDAPEEQVVTVEIAGGNDCLPASAFQRAR
jgi:hypothetical protein